MRFTFILTLLVTCSVTLWGRDPEGLDKERLFTQAITAARAALDPKQPPAVQLDTLTKAIGLLTHITRLYPNYQAASTAVRLESCRNRFALLTASQPVVAVDTPHDAPRVEVYNRLEQLLRENIELRDKLDGYEQDEKNAPILTLSDDYQNALMTVASLQAELAELTRLSGERAKQRAAESLLYEEELKAQGKVILTLRGESERRAKRIGELEVALKTAAGKTFGKEQGLADLKKANQLLEQKQATLRAEVDAVHTALTRLKAGDATALTKTYMATRAALLRQANLMGAEREKAQKAIQTAANLQKSLDVLQIQNASLRQEIKQYEQGADALIIGELENTVLTYKKRLTVLTKAGTEKQNELDEWRFINKELHKSLNASTAAGTAISSANLQELVATQTVLIETLKQDGREQAAEIADLHDQLAARASTAVKPQTTGVPEPEAELSDEDAQNLLLFVQQAKAALLNNNLERAKRLCTDALKLDASNGDANLCLAQIFIKEMAYDNAESYARRAPVSGDNLRVLETLYSATDRSDRLLAELFNAVASEPENIEYRLILIQNLRRLKSVSLAEMQLNILLKQAPDSFECAREFYFLYSSMGSKYINLQKKWYNSALKIDSQRRNELKLNE